MQTLLTIEETNNRKEVIENFRRGNEFYISSPVYAGVITSADLEKGVKVRIKFGEGYRQEVKVKA